MSNTRKRLLNVLALIIALVTLINVWTSHSQVNSRNASFEGTEKSSFEGLTTLSSEGYKWDHSHHTQGTQQQTSTLASMSHFSSLRPISRPLVSQSTRQRSHPTELENSTSIHASDFHPNNTLPQVQALPDQGDIKPPRVLPLTDRPLFQSIEDLWLIRASLDLRSIDFDNSTINSILPSKKVASNPLTLWNIEIPLNYSLSAPMTSTVPWSNRTTLAFYEGRLRSGFRNQMMAFVILILEANSASHGQFLLRSLGQKDTYGTNSFIPFAKLWDVEHWNSHYPRLPRLVDYDPILHSQFNFDNTRWYRTPVFDDVNNTQLSFVPPANWFGTYGLFATPKPSRPFGYGYQHKLMAAYTHYAKGKGRYAVSLGNNTANHRNPAEILMLQGAMRPHPDLQAIIDRLLIEASLLPANQSTSLSDSTMPLQLDYLTLHARVEPDMQKHGMCPQKKVLNLTDIFNFMESKWKVPPVSKIFMPINRQYLELEGDIYDHETNGTTIQRTTFQKKRHKARKKINWIAVENLQALNRARDHGLWGGRAKVFEFGANALDGTSYASKPSTAGAMLNFFIGVPAKIFIGTEVSSFSHDLLATRFFRGYSHNYKYLPDGLHEWTPSGTIDPPGFEC